MSSPKISSNAIIIHHCRQHNLKNISLEIPKGKVVVITGVSGSGKSSLAFDTVFAEAQRRYLEFLSPQARSWIKQMTKPDVDLIEGLSPALAVNQKHNALSSQNTIATQTDIDDFFALLFARVGEQHSPFTGKKLKRYTRQEIIETILNEYPIGTKLQIIAPIKLIHETLQEAVQRLQKMGFIRLRLEGEEIHSEEISPLVYNEKPSKLDVIIDRIEIKEGIRDRLSDSVNTALDLGKGILTLIEGRDGLERYFTEIFICPETSFSFPPLQPADFNFRSRHGACPHCQGKGGREKVIPNKLEWNPSIPLHDQILDLLEKFPRKIAVLYAKTWNAFIEEEGVKENSLQSETTSKDFDAILNGSSKPLTILVDIEEKKTILKTHWKGIISLIDTDLQDKEGKSRFSHSIFVSWQRCEFCKGARLKPESLSCLIEGNNIYDFYTLTLSQLSQKIQHLKLNKKQQTIAQDILPEITNRLSFLEEVGLGYLQLERSVDTLSEGEAQRVQLASQIGAKLSGIIYVLDEPSRGLHFQDVDHLIRVIHKLRDLGNTLLIVEHQRNMIIQAEHVIELGPGSGIHGGMIIFQGNIEQLISNEHSPTGLWLKGKVKNLKKQKMKSSPLKQRKPLLSIRNVNKYNLVDFNVDIPLGCLVAFCGLSGSGKSTLGVEIIAAELKLWLTQQKKCPHLEGYQTIKRLNLIEQQSIGYSPRSIPATYINVMTPLRQLFASTKLAKARGYSPSRFSLNKKGGRCEACEGQGSIRIGMQFMSDLFIPCDVCEGKRYNYETLQITWENLSIADILDLKVEEAHRIFQHFPDIALKLSLMEELGLSYLTLGQHFNTLSGGEIQRLKLVADLAVQNQDPTLYILDEPSAGLHYQDIEKLLKIFDRLVEKGHSLFVIEHQLDILQHADWLIELGPGGGPQGGRLIFEGSCENLLKLKTPTSQALLSTERGNFAIIPE